MIDGGAIREARLRAGLGPAELAERLGVHETTVWRWEAGRTKRVDYGTARRIAELLEVPVDSLFAIHGNAERDTGTANASSPSVEAAAR